MSKTRMRSKQVNKLAAKPEYFENMPVNWVDRRSELAWALSSVRERIDAACLAAGRSPEEVSLVAVTKNHPWTDALALYSLGERDFGENRVQELLPKIEQMAEQGLNPRWHLIGTLQRNKVKYISGKTALIHSVDSERLAREISRQAEERSLTERILLQVNYSGEASKQGFRPADLLRVLPQLAALPGLHFGGLMTMAEQGATPERLEETFSGVRELLVQAQNALPSTDGTDFTCLSMGMTEDFEIAVRCGATHLRIGSALLGQREY